MRCGRTTHKEGFGSFFVGIILTYIYVRIEGALCLSPSPPLNSSVLAF